MQSSIPCICVIFLFNILFTLTTSSSFLGSDEEISVFNSESKKPVLRSEGIFERFVRNWLDTLKSHFIKHYLRKYLKLLSHQLHKLKYSEAKQLAEHVKKLSKMDEDEVWLEVEEYRNEFNNKLPQRSYFLDLMNDVFWGEQNVHFDDYIEDLRAYAGGLKYSIDAETENLLQNTILGSVKKMSNRERRKLLKALHNATEEYTGGPESNSGSDDSLNYS